MNQSPDACKMQTSGLFSIWLQLFDGFCGKEGIDVHFVQIALSVGVFVEVGQRKNGFQLPADLFARGCENCMPPSCAFSCSICAGLCSGVTGILLMMCRSLSSV